MHFGPQPLGSLAVTFLAQGFPQTDRDFALALFVFRRNQFQINVQFPGQHAQGRRFARIELASGSHPQRQLRGFGNVLQQDIRIEFDPLVHRRVSLIFFLIGRRQSIAGSLRKAEFLDHSQLDAQFVFRQNLMRASGRLRGGGGRCRVGFRRHRWHRFRLFFFGATGGVGAAGGGIGGAGATFASSSATGGSSGRIGASVRETSRTKSSSATATGAAAGLARAKYSTPATPSEPATARKTKAMANAANTMGSHLRLAATGGTDRDRGGFAARCVEVVMTGTLEKEPQRRIKLNGLRVLGYPPTVITRRPAVRWQIRTHSRR